MERQVSVVTDIFKLKQIQPLYPVSLNSFSINVAKKIAPFLFCFTLPLRLNEQ